MTLQQRIRDPGFWLALVRWLLPVALVIVVAALLADTFWLWWSGPDDAVPRDPDLPRVEVRDQGRRSARVEYEVVRDWSLFGDWQAQQGAGTDGDDPVDAPETRLQLELLGVFQTGETDGRPGAIIAEQGENGELFRVGDRLPGNARLDRVYADRVMLRRQGRLETLKLKSPKLQSGIEAASRDTDSPGQRGPRNTGQSDDGDNGSDKGLSGDVESQRKRIIRGLGLESNEKGYVIGESAPAQLLDRVGLKPGDVVVSVNGHDVGQKKADLAALRAYHDKGSAEIVIQRGSQRFTVTVPP